MQTAPTFGRRGIATAAAPATPAYAPPRPAPPPEALAQPRANGAGGDSLRFLLSLLFSFEGRLQRRDYRLIRIVWYPAVLLILYGLGRLNNPSNSLTETLLLLLAILAVLVMMVWTTLALQVRRWHDRDKSWPWLFVGFIPIAGPIWVAVELLFLEGTIGPNRFGPSPKGDPGDVFD